MTDVVTVGLPKDVHTRLVKMADGRPLGRTVGRMLDLLERAEINATLMKMASPRPADATSRVLDAMAHSGSPQEREEARRAIRELDA